MPLSGVSKIVHLLLSYGSLSTGDRKRVASIASPALTLTRVSSDTSACVAALLVTLITLSKSTSLEAIDATRLFHWFYVDESSACYGRQNAGAEIADPELSAVYAESQTRSVSVRTLLSR